MNILTRICRKLVVCSQKKHGKETYIALCWKPFFLNRKIGSAHNFIKWSDKLEKIGNDETYAVVYHHSHPFDWGLSPEDLEVLRTRPALKEMWAHTVQGSSFCARVSCDRAMLEQALLDVRNRRHYSNAGQWDFAPSGYSEDIHNEIVDHVACELLRDNGHIEYEFTLSDKLTELLDKNENHRNYLYNILKHSADEILQKAYYY